jgi:hypothetical protein
MTSEGLREMFEGDMCAGKFLLVLMGGRAEGLACADPVARPPSALAEIKGPWKVCVIFFSTRLNWWLDQTINAKPGTTFNIPFENRFMTGFNKDTFTLNNSN